MAFLLFVRYEDEITVGVEVMHSSEAPERLMAARGTNVRFHELGPLNHWMNEPQQLSFLNSARQNVSREQISGLIESNRNKQPSTLISSLEDYLRRTAPDTDTSSTQTTAEANQPNANQRSWFKRLLCCSN
jgi:hypothetical protein